MDSSFQSNTNSLPHFGNQQEYESNTAYSYVYCWGRNKDGELSIGTNIKFTSTPKPVKGIKNFQIKDLSLGSQHSVLVTEEGKVYACGSALHGKLGIDEGQATYSKFLPIQGLSDAKQVSVGDYHTMALLNNGQVYAWGGTLHKKLGQRAGKPAPIPSLQSKIVIQIGCGDFHSAALTQDGDLFTWGGGGRDYNRGQLGHGHLNDIEVPQKVQINEIITKIACGGYHMMVLGQENNLYSWGQGMYGETGLGEFQDFTTPKQVKFNLNQKNVIVNDMYRDNQTTLRIIDIKLGGHHSLILTENGLVYACGYAQYGQLGLKLKENQFRLQLVTGLHGKNIISIAAGWNHSLALTSQGDLFSCGYNSAGQLGLGDEESRTTFQHVQSLQGKNIKEIYAGGSHSWVVIDQNNPIIQNYTPPSPTKDEIQKINYNSEQQQTSDPQKNIEVIVSEVDLYHRFVRVKISQNQESQFKVRLNDYLNCLQKDATLKLSKFQNDQEANGQQNVEGIVSYTIMLVYDIKKSQNQNLEQGQMTAIGQQYFLKVKNVTQKPTNKFFDWVVQAERMLPYQTKFFEIRPV